MIFDPDLPDELQMEAGDAFALKKERLDTLSMLVSRKKDEAVSGRGASGIETIWREDDESYEGFDDANRSESHFIKGQTLTSGLRTRAPHTGMRSTMFLNITRPYVDAAAARVSDMLLPTDDRSFEFKPEPVPELTKKKDDATPAMDKSGRPLMKETEQGPVPATHGDIAKEAMEIAKKSSESAQTRVDDWLVECGYHAEKRKAIHDCAKLGTCVLKGPFPVKRAKKSVTQTPSGIELREEKSYKPASKRIDIWNLYPDPGCGENIHNGNYLLEKDYMTARQVKDLIGVPGYIETQLMECLKEGAQKENVSDRREQDKKNLYEVWYYYGSLDREGLDAANCEFAGKDGDTLYAIITLINDRVVKAALSHLDSGEFPYDVMPWQVKSGSWTGIGVARQMRAAQGMIVAGSRNLMDNAALSGGPILAINRSMLQPADGNWALAPRKIFYSTDEAEGVDVRSAIASFDIPSKQQELMGIIEFALKMAEQTTGMPMLLQGQVGNAPDTLGGQILANNNASTVLRRLARLDDDYITEPHMARYYEYLMLHGPEESEKGQFSVDARGSSVLVERDIQNHATIQMLQLSVNPAFGADPKKAFAEACRVQRLDPARFQYTEEEQAKMAQQPPPEAPQIQAAKLNAQTTLHKQDMADQTAIKIAQSRDTLASHKVDVDTDRDRVYNESMAARDAANHQATMTELQLRRELSMLDYANKHQISLEKVKADLAQTAMKLKTQTDLSIGAHAVDVHKHRNPPPVITPPTEPAGRAKPGEAFQA